MTLQYQEQPRKPILSHVLLTNITCSFFCLNVQMQLSEAFHLTTV
jgi:hypothetical protein